MVLLLLMTQRTREEKELSPGDHGWSSLRTLFTCALDHSRLDLMVSCTVFLHNCVLSTSSPPHLVLVEQALESTNASAGGRQARDNVVELARVLRIELQVDASRP